MNGGLTSLFYIALSNGEFVSQFLVPPRWSGRLGWKRSKLDVGLNWPAYRVHKPMTRSVWESSGNVGGMGVLQVPVQVGQPVSLDLEF